MIRITAKVKIAAGLAAGALTLGGAGAYAAANNNGTIPVSNLQDVTLSGDGAAGLTLQSTNGKTTTLTIPATFKNQGQCVSLFAQHQDLVLKPEAGTTRISKNSHGKLVSTIKAFCEPLVESDSTKTHTPDATESDSASTDSLSGKLHGHGHAYGHGKHVAD
jgi:virulence-associated protein VagC